MSPHFSRDGRPAGGCRLASPGRRSADELAASQRRGYLCPRSSVHAAVARMVSGISPLVTRSGSRTGIAVQASPADCAYSMARRVCVDIDSISADGTRRVAVPVLVRVYAFVADCTPRPAVAVAVSAGVLTTDPASRIAISISIGVYGAAAVNAGRIARSIRVKDAILAVGRKN
jgi:hypothetical protein